MLEYAFPSLALLLQSALKLTVDRRANGIDFVRSLLLLPADLAFLSVSIAAISLARMNREALAQQVWLVPVVMLIGFIALISSAFFSSRTNEAFDGEQSVKVSICVAVGYATSSMLLWGAFNLGAFLG